MGRTKTISPFLQACWISQHRESCFGQPPLLPQPCPCCCFLEWQDSFDHVFPQPLWTDVPQDNWIVRDPRSAAGVRFEGSSSHSSGHGAENAPVWIHSNPFTLGTWSLPSCTGRCGRQCLSLHFYLCQQICWSEPSLLYHHPNRKDKATWICPQPHYLTRAGVAVLHYL